MPPKKIYTIQSIAQIQADFQPSNKASRNGSSKDANSAVTGVEIPNWAI
jgi:hypothetical protein